MGRLEELCLILEGRTMDDSLSPYRPLESAVT